ncbi:hypothetical protein GGU11DRAFT_750583 [Lentinula aff. detonsa]|nr:hypothetical protein GGU11DRAFT_750583 [Lentinula aff. detonsa]
MSKAEQHKSEKMLIELVQAWYFDTEQLGQFFNEGQAKLSFYPEKPQHFCIQRTNCSLIL